MNIREAIAVNVLLRYLLKDDGGIGVPSELDAAKAAAELSRHANKALSAGLTPDQVIKLWPWTNPDPKSKPRPRKDAK